MFKDKSYLLAIGMFALIAAILLGRYVDPSPVINFLEGMFYGLSLVLNAFFLIMMRKQRKES